jgi:hypothetical protein
MTPLVDYIQLLMRQLLVNDKLETTWKEAVVA